MNLVQLAKKARLGCDAILPGNVVSSQWSDEELVDLINTSYEEIYRRYRLVRKKWGMVTVKQTDAPFGRDGEVYTPSTALQVTSASVQLSLPPDFAEVVRILCLNDKTVRFSPGEIESRAWINMEQDGYDAVGNVLPDATGGLTVFYDLVGPRTLQMTPPVATTLNLQVDYIPLKCPLYYSNAGTVEQNATTTLIGTGTSWSSDNVYTAATGNWAELMTGSSSFTYSGWRLDRDYPHVARINSNTLATMKVASTLVAGMSFVMAMAPALPRDVHRWIADYTSALMLKKINPELAKQYGGEVLERYTESIRPSMTRRQTQESSVTEDSDEFGSVDY